MYQIGLIRVLTTDDQTLLQSHGRMLMEYFPAFSIESRCILDQSEGIHDDETMALARPKILALAEEYRQKDAIIVSCAGDPAVEELKKVMPIPVIGAGTAVSLLASGMGDRVGVLGITGEPPKPYLEKLGDRILDLGVPEGVGSTLDLMTEAGQRACIRKGQELKAAGAELIALACTGFSTVGFAKVLERELQIPVLDPVVCEGVIAYFELLRR